MKTTMIAALAVILAIGLPTNSVAAPPSSLDSCFTNYGGQYNPKLGSLTENPPRLFRLPIEPAAGGGTFGVVHWFTGPGIEVEPYHQMGWVQDALCTMVADLLQCLEDLFLGSGTSCNQAQLDFIADSKIKWDPDQLVVVAQPDGLHIHKASVIVKSY